MTGLPDHVGVEGSPPEDRAIEAIDLLTQRRGQAADWKRQLHMVESHFPVLSSRRPWAWDYILLAHDTKLSEPRCPRNRIQATASALSGAYSSKNSNWSGGSNLREPPDGGSIVP